MCCAKFFLWYNSDMILSRRNCQDCGFLCFMVGSGYTKAVEYSPKERAEGIERFSPFSLPHCYRHDYVFETEWKSILDNMPNVQSNFGETVYPKEKLNAILNLTTKKRRCKLYMKYAPGYSPELHLSRFETFERERSNRRWNLVWLLVGVALTVAGGWLVNQFR